MISHRYKCIFVHIPKCGGTSIENVIWPEPHLEADLAKGMIEPYRNKYQTGGMQHLFARHIRQEVGDEIFNSYFKFAIVRNPWDRAVSQFIYLKTRRRDLRRFLGVTRFVTLKSYLRAIQKTVHVHWDEQYKFLVDEHGNQIVDYVGRFEDLDSEFRKIATLIGLQQPSLPHEKKSRRTHYRDYLNASSRDMVASIYRRDIETFGYEF